MATDNLNCPHRIQPNSAEYLHATNFLIIYLRRIVHTPKSPLYCAYRIYTGFPNLYDLSNRVTIWGQFWPLLKRATLFGNCLRHLKIGLCLKWTFQGKLITNIACSPHIYKCFYLCKLWLTSTNHHLIRYLLQTLNGLVSISSTLYERIFRTNVVSAAFF